MENIHTHNIDLVSVQLEGRELGGSEETRRAVCLGWKYFKRQYTIVAGDLFSVARISRFLSPLHAMTAMNYLGMVEILMVAELLVV